MLWERRVVRAQRAAAVRACVPLPSDTLSAAATSMVLGVPATLANVGEWRRPGRDWAVAADGTGCGTCVDLSLSLPAGSRCLLLGANGSGKSTLLRLLAGKHLVPREAVSVCGGAPFYDTALTTSGQIAYVGGAWTRDVAFAGNDMPLQGDFSAREMLYNVPNVDEARRLRLIEVLDIDLEWRMHQLSDGQRRRVQLAMGLLRPFQALLLDEVRVKPQHALGGIYSRAFQGKREGGGRGRSAAWPVANATSPILKPLKFVPSCQGVEIGLRM